MTAREVLVPAQERADAAAMLQDYIAEMALFVRDVRLGKPIRTSICTGPNQTPVGRSG